MIAKTESILLKLLLDGERCGRDLRYDYRARTGKRLSIAKLYTCLGVLQDDNCVVAWQEQERWPERGGNRRTFFYITPRGRTISHFGPC